MTEMIDWIEVDPLPPDAKVRDQMVTLASGPFGTIAVIGASKFSKLFRVFWIHGGKWYQLHKVGELP